MIEALGLGAAAVALAAIAAAVYFGREALTAKDERLTAAELAHAAERAETDAEQAALDAMARAKAAELTAAQATRLLAATQDRARRAEEALHAHVREATLHGSDDDVAALVSGMLERRLAGPEEYHTNARRDGDAAGPAAVRPAAAAGADHSGVGPAAGGRG